MNLRRALMDCAGENRIEAICETLSTGEIEFLLHDWLTWARPDQLPPLCSQAGCDWTAWLILGGRGSGKTRAGAEWVRGVALGKPGFAKTALSPIALVGESLHDVRAVMVEGPSGLLSIHPASQRPSFSFSRRELEWPNGAKAQIFSADDPESLRGPQFAAAWCDELCKWRYGEAAWSMLQFCLRLGNTPRQVVTTTPRPTAILKMLLADPRTAISRAKTEDNAANLAPAFLSSVVARYQGTALGRQELDGELIEDREGALWRATMLDKCRVADVPQLERVVVAVDPAVTGRASSDRCGIVVAGRGGDGRGYILEDATRRASSPLAWAQTVVALFHTWQADCVVAEVNQGGDLVETVLRHVDSNLPVRAVRASRGKVLRAEPVAALYEQGKVSHAGAFPELEAEMRNFSTAGVAGSRSPDRVDALVWALTELLLAPLGQPRIRTLI